MAEPGPILQYATPSRLPPPLLRASAIVLFIWGGFDILAGTIGIIASGSALALEPTSFLIAIPLIILSVCILNYGGECCRLARRIMHLDGRSLRNACILVLFAEIVMWIICFIILFIAGSDHHWLSRPHLSEIVADSSILLFPLSITLTRMVLRRAGRHLPTQGHSSGL